jgi:mono/diheme cytochrome c family protein
MRWLSRWPSQRLAGVLGKRLAGALVGLVCALSGSLARADDNGKDLFQSYCASCHGLDGRAKTSPGHYYRIPDWTTTDATKKLKDDQVRKQIRTGKLQEGQTGMPAFRSLSDAQVDLLIAFVRKLSAAPGN